MESRLVQFVVEQPCKVSCSPGRRSHILAQSEKLPFPVWVEWPAEGPDPNCGEPYYIVTPESVREAYELFGLPQTARYARVCEHMGRVIE